MGQALWQTGLCGALVSDTAGFRLVVSPVGSAVRYQVLRPVPGGPQALVASGHSDTVRVAMAEAERVAGRLELLAAVDGSAA